MAVETNLEREFKFDVDTDFDPPDLRPLVGGTERLPEQHLTTTYFDTEDRRLWAVGVTLRHRVEAEGEAGSGGLGKWTLKLPTSGTEDQAVARSELTWRGDLGQIPAEALSVVAGLVRRARLEPAVVLSTERRRLLIHGEDRAGWAEMDDDLVNVTSGPRAGLRFRQLELELLGPDGDGRSDRILEELRRAGAEPGGGSKFALAAGLDEPGAGPETEPVAYTGGLAPVVGRILAADLDGLLRWDYRLRVPPATGDQADIEVEAVHQARVATRRLRSDLKTLEPVLDPVWTKHTEADLKWVGRLLGRLRDEDVLVERMRGADPGGDVEALEELIRLLRADRHLDATELCEALTSARYTELLDRLQAAARTPPLLDATGEDLSAAPVQATLRSVVAARFGAWRMEVAEVGPQPSDAQLHQVRILAKRVRYAAEAVQPYLGPAAKKAARTARRAKDLQSLLGDLNDAAIAARNLRELASHPSVTPAVAFVAGRIAGRAEGEAARLRGRWRRVAGRLEEQSPDGWPGAAV